MAVQEEELVSAKYLVNKLHISDKYLRGLMTRLAKCGLIQSIQGREGGYRIIQPLKEIYLVEIVRAVEDVEKYLGCVLGFEECSKQNPCALHDKWNEMKFDTATFLNTITLNDIVADKSILRF